MEIKITTTQILKVLQLLSWVIFIGLCVEAGGILVNTFITLFINPGGVKNYWEGTEYLSSLLLLDNGHFFVITLIMCTVGVLKVLMFYLIVKLFTDKQLNIDRPFSEELRIFILKVAYLALGIGLFSHSGSEYAAWLTQQGVPAPDLKVLDLAGADVWIFMAVILFVISQIFRRGIEIQTENELTV